MTCQSGFTNFKKFTTVPCMSAVGKFVHLEKLFVFNFEPKTFIKNKVY